MKVLDVPGVSSGCVKVRFPSVSGWQRKRGATAGSGPQENRLTIDAGHHGDTVRWLPVSGPGDTGLHTMPLYTRRPNFMFLFPDQWRWDWLGCAQAVPVRTPHLDALAARGVRFGQCRTNSPLCAPARAALATGRRYERTGVIDNGQDTDPAQGTIFQLLRSAGYRVATCGKSDLHKGSKDFSASGWVPRLGRLGFTEALDQGGKWDAYSRLTKGLPEAYTAYLTRHGVARVYAEDMQRRLRLRQSPAGHLLDTAPHGLPRQHYTDDFCGRAALDLLDSLPPAAPWLLWVNFPGPHEPFDPPRELQQRYDHVCFPPPVEPNAVPNDHQQIRRNYAAMIEGIDEWCGRLLQHVAERRELDDTVVIFASDHGEMLGDHGRWYKSCAYEGSIHVPLIVAGPGIRAGWSDALVELIDVAATIAELAGLAVPAAWDARSFAPLLTGAATAPHRDVQLATLRDWKMIFDGRWKMIQTQGAPPLLWDMDRDLGETHNCAAEQAPVVARLAQLLDGELAAGSQRGARWRPRDCRRRDFR